MVINFKLIQKERFIKFVPRGTTGESLISNLIPSLNDSVFVVDKNGLERTKGEIYPDDQLVVMSEDGRIQKVYFISMLPSTNIPQNNYLDYVLSDVYNINQRLKLLNDTIISTSVTEFMNNLKFCTGAKADVVHSDGTQNTGSLQPPDRIRVVSKDG